MNKQGMIDLSHALSALGVFSGLCELPLFSSFFAMCSEDVPTATRAAGRFAHAIYEAGGSLSDAVRRAVFADENPYVRMRAGKGNCDPCIARAVKQELSYLSSFASLTPANVEALLGRVPYVPPFVSRSVNLVEEYEERMCDIKKHGYGIFASNAMFRLTEQGDIEPVACADDVTLDAFIGYEEERAQIMDNTKAFLDGRPAANVLLYGDAGTGKSSTVKAITNALFEDGLRLIEIRKDQLSRLPYVMGKIRQNPLHFIIFIDDLSFNKSDDSFSMLKAALEGSASAKAPNAVIYATSNRRHIVRESFGDRDGTDVHRNDTMKETLSLSARFGMTVLFARPNKQLYLRIVSALADKYHITEDKETLAVRAEAFALARGTRSARCAEQFIDSLR